MIRRNGRKIHHHPVPMSPMPGKGGAPSFGGAVPPALRRSPAQGQHVCTCPPLVPGWPDATVNVAIIDTANFWQTVSSPCVFRVVSVLSGGLSPEEIAELDRSLFIFLVRPRREDADVKALADVLREQGGLLPGKPVDLSGEGKMLMQIVAVLQEREEGEAAEG